MNALPVAPFPARAWAPGEIGRGWAAIPCTALHGSARLRHWV